MPDRAYQIRGRAGEASASPFLRLEGGTPERGIFDGLGSYRESTKADVRNELRTIAIDPKALARIEEFAAYFNISVQEAMNKAVTEWMDATGDVMMAYTENERRKVATRPKLTLVRRQATGV